MLCSYCKMARMANEEPCPNCGAPSPLLKISKIDDWGTDTRSVSLNNRGGGQDAVSIGNSWSRVEPTAWNSSFNAVSLPQTSTLNEQVKQTAALSVPALRGNKPAAGANLSTVSLHLIPEQFVEHLLPAPIEKPEMWHVPPMYTKTRPTTPRYRIISGFLSIMIVSLLLCGGLGYYVKVSGKLDALLQFYNTGSLQQGNAGPKMQLPDAPDKVDAGPAYTIIPSATTAKSIDANNFAPTAERAFAVNQPFFLTYSVQSPQGQSGKVMVKWYANNELLRSISSDKVIQGGTWESGSVKMIYSLSTEGTVEIYWNEQLAQRLYFVVR